MDESQIEVIRDIQANLLRIQETGRAAVNLNLYEKKLGLVRSVNKQVALPSGKSESRFDKLVLTAKGEQVLGAALYTLTLQHFGHEVPDITENTDGEQ